MSESFSSGDVIKKGFLEKHGGKGIMSSWQTRWFVLTQDSLSYYTDQAMSVKKGDVSLNHLCSIKRKAPEGSRKFLLVLENQISGRNLILCPHDLATLSSWEQAISTVLEELGREYKGVLDEQQQLSGRQGGGKLLGPDGKVQPRRSVIPSIDADEDLSANEVLKDGYLHKQGHRVQSWTKRWFTLTPHLVTYYADESMEVTKGALAVDQYSSLTRKKAPRRSSISDQNRQFLFHLHMGSSPSQRTDLLMSAASEDERLAWEVAISKVALRHRLANHTIAVCVYVCDDHYPFLVPTEEPVYVVKIFRFGKQLGKEFFHFSDMRKVYKRLAASSSVVSSKFSVDESFPRSYKRNAFGVQLGEEEVEGRRFQLERWLQSALDKFRELVQLRDADSSEETAVICEAVASLYGCTSEQLAVYSNPSVCTYAGMVSKQGDSDDDVEEPDSDDDVEPPGGEGAVVADQASSDHKGNVQMPEKPSALKSFTLKSLAQLCIKNHIDCSTFKAQKHYVKALMETYQKRLPYLHDKDARAVVRKLGGVVESETRKQVPLDPETVTEIDNIFSDLLYKLQVEEGLMSTLQVEHCAEDKMIFISQAISIWDTEVTFTAEDADMLRRLCAGKKLDTFLILTLKCRLQSASASNQWMDWFCAARGVSCIVHAMDIVYDRSPVGEVGITNVLALLQCVRLVVESPEGWQAVLDTRGAVDSVAHALTVPNRTLQLEVLEVLTETVICGGADGGNAVGQAIRHVSGFMKLKPLEVLVVLCRDDEVSVQCAVLGLVNALLLYESDLHRRLEIRQSLSFLDFDQVCAAWIKDYRLAGNSMLLPSKVPETAPPVPPAPVAPEDSGAVEDAADVTETGMYEEDGYGEGADLTFNTKIRPGVRIADLCVQEGLADNEETIIHPEVGVMEGFALEIIENPAAAASAREQSGSGESAEGAAVAVGNIGKFVSDRFSLSRLSGNARPSSFGPSGGGGGVQGLPGGGKRGEDDFRARRMWYRLSDRTLSWSDNFDSADSLGSLAMNMVTDVAEFGALSAQTLKCLQNCFSIIFRDGRTYHMCADSKNIKLQWLVALQAAVDKCTLHRLPVRLPREVKVSGASTVLSLRKDFEQHVNMYKSLSSEDVASTYAGEVLDVMEGRVAATDPDFDPIRLAMFVYYELKSHRNAGKIFTPLQELSAYVHGHYAPKPVVDDDEFDGSKYPRAVPQSDEPLPKAPPLPFVPDAKPIKKPNIKVKQLFWNPVKPANVVNTLWRDMEEPDVNWQQFDTQFAAVQPRSKVKPRSGVASSDSTKPKAIALFDSRRTQNVAIACGKLKKSPEEIFDLALTMDPEELTADVNDTILNLLLPTSDEIATLKTYTGEVEDLDFCGKLFAYFTEIDRLEQRLVVQRTMLNWFEQADVVVEQLNVVRSAVSEFSDESSMAAFREVLSVILSVGNYMNGGTRRGQVHGYRLDLLLKLRDVKQTGGRKTLLHFIVDHLSPSPDTDADGQAGDSGGAVVAKEPFYSTWKHVWLATKVHMGNLEVLVRELQSALETCMQEIEAAEEMENDKIKLPLIERLSECSSNIVYYDTIYYNIYINNMCVSLF